VVPDPGDEGLVPDSPAGLKALNRDKLAILAGRVRARLIEVVAANGGHLSPNLGAVELTIALHRAFESPEDKLIWDVGHQSYVHKLLTGRWKAFSTLRKAGGLSGFPRRSESPSDVFETGHASTSISAALGMAKARDLAGQRHHVVAVIGDGALTGGMAFEAINHAGQVRTRLIIVLNDNSMSIARSVGGFPAYLSRVRTHPLYSRTKQDLKELLNRLPGGAGLATFIGRLKTSLKYLLIPGVLFEELGLTYLGPVNGHDLDQLLMVFAQAKAIQGPVLVHCLTRKGKGYLPAELDPNRFHGIGPFDPSTGKPPDRRDGRRTYSEVFGGALLKLCREDRRVCAVTAAMPDGTGLRPVIDAFPSRVFDVGIAEQHAVTFAAGLASGGLRPVVAVYSTFLQRAYDQTLHDVCLQGLPVVFALDRAGIVGEDGPTHHGTYDLSYLRAMPGMVLAVPRDGDMLEAMLRLGLNHHGPFALRYPRGTVPGDPIPMAHPQGLAIGRGELLRDGNDLAICAVGPIVYEVLRAAELLAAQGVEAAVFDARFVKPLDSKAISALASRTGRLLTVEEGVAQGGFGGAVLESLAARGELRDLTVRVIGLPDHPVPHGPAAVLRKAAGLDARSIADVAREMAG